MFVDDTLYIDNIWNNAPSADFTPSQTVDLLQLLEKMARRHGYVHLTTDDLLRQPIQRRQGRLLTIPDASLDVQNILTLAERMIVIFSNVEGFQVVSFIINALNDRNPFADARLFVKAENLLSPIKKSHIGYIRMAMNKTRFRGSIKVGHDDLFNAIVSLGQIDVGQGKKIEKRADGLEITIA